MRPILKTEVSLRDRIFMCHLSKYPKKSVRRKMGKEKCEILGMR
jgi:hypothetical protein